MSIAIEGKGALVIPATIIEEYWKKNNVSILSNGRRNIRIRECGGLIYLYNSSKQNLIDVTEYLHQF